MVNKVISGRIAAQSTTMRQETLPIVDETKYMPLEEMHKRLVATITHNPI